MKFSFTRYNLGKREARLERALEIVPGATSWCIIIGTIILSITSPLVAAVCIIAFDIYWILRLFYMNIFLVLSYLLLSTEKKTDWMARLKGLEQLDTYLDRIKTIPRQLSFRRKLSLYLHKRHLQQFKESNGSGAVPAVNDIYHIVIIAVAKETLKIVEPGIHSIAHGTFPANRILVVLAVEGRAQAQVHKDMAYLRDTYRKYFYDLLLSVHPEGVPGEARVKGANTTYAAKAAEKYVKEKGISLENIIVSCFDADTVVSQHYFSALTYYYVITPDRTRASFQPIPVFHNNIWEAPSFARVLDIGSSFFQLVEATNPEKLITFSSHSMSFKALVEVGYWPVDMISDDSMIFWKAFIHYDGNYQVVPMYITLSMDVTNAGSWLKTIRSVYKQKRRWAWGVENFPIVIRAFLRMKSVPLSRRLKHAYKLFEGHISWATWPILLGIIGWLPALFAGREFAHSIVFYSSPRIKETIFSLASLGLLICILLSFRLLPKQPVRHNFLRKVRHAFEWILIPLVTVFLSAIPALDAQTRLMLGKYMEFWVTPKERAVEDKR